MHTTRNLLFALALLTACADDDHDSAVPPALDAGAAREPDAAAATGDVNRKPDGKPNASPSYDRPDASRTYGGGDHSGGDWSDYGSGFGGDYGSGYDPEGVDRSKLDDPEHVDFAEKVNGYQIVHYTDGQLIVSTPQGDSCVKNVGPGINVSLKNQNGVADLTFNGVAVIRSNRCV